MRSSSCTNTCNCDNLLERTFSLFGFSLSFHFHDFLSFLTFPSHPIFRRFFHSSPHMCTEWLFFHIKGAFAFDKLLTILYLLPEISINHVAFCAVVVFVRACVRVYMDMEECILFLLLFNMPYAYCCVYFYFIPFSIVFVLLPAHTYRLTTLFVVCYSLYIAPLVCLCMR